VDAVAGLQWRVLAEADESSLVELAQACLAADGGQPFAASSWFLRRCYLSGADTQAGFAGARLVCVSSLRPGDRAVTTGLVHPAWRRRGIGGRAFDQAADYAGQAALTAESEALSDGAHALYLSRGLTQVLAEDVMQLPAGTQLQQAHPPAGLTLSHWGQADPARFYAAYRAAFRDRPGGPARTQAGWVEWISDDEDFRADWTLLATLDGADVGFIAAEATGWIAQMGVVPSARGRDIGAHLINEAVRRMRSAGEGAITLNVNVDNPHAAALYGRLGFTRVGRRARYQRSPSAAG
jgi:mycothiol synthase